MNLETVQTIVAEDNIYFRELCKPYMLMYDFLFTDKCGNCPFVFDKVGERYCCSKELDWSVS